MTAACKNDIVIIHLLVLLGKTIYTMLSMFLNLVEESPRSE